MKLLQNTTTGDMWEFEDSDDLAQLVARGVVPATLTDHLVARPSADHTWDATTQAWVAPSPFAPKLTMMQRIKLLIGV